MAQQSTKRKAPAKAATSRKTQAKKAPAKKPVTSEADAPEDAAPKKVPAKKAPAKKAVGSSKVAAAKAKARAAKAKQEEDKQIEEAAAPVNKNHNGGPGSDGTVAGEQLRKFIERIERLEEEKKDIAEDQKEVYASARAVGFDTKIMRKVVARRKRDRDALREEESLIDVYEHAIGGGDMPDPVGE